MRAATEPGELTETPDTEPMRQMLAIVEDERGELCKVAGMLRCISALVLNEDTATLHPSDVNDSIDMAIDALNGIAVRLEPMCIEARILAGECGDETSLERGMEAK